MRPYTFTQEQAVFLYNILKPISDKRELPNQLKELLALLSRENVDAMSKQVVIQMQHHKQWGHKAHWFRNDCGQACAAMILEHLTPYRKDVNRISVEIRQTNNRNLGVRAFQQYLRRHGLWIRHYSQWSKDKEGNPKPLTFDRIKAGIDQGNPVVALVWYGKLPADVRWHGTDFKAWHYVVISGYSDKSIFFHDPLNEDGPTECGIDPFIESMTGWGQQPNQGFAVGKYGGGL